MDKNYKEDNIRQLQKDLLANRNQQNNRINAMEVDRKAPISNKRQQVNKQISNQNTTQQVNRRTSSSLKNKKSKRKLTLKKVSNKVFKGKHGLRNRLIAFGLAVLTAGTVAAAIVEDYQDKDERLIATVEDIGNDEFKDSIPAKIDWKDRKKLSSELLIDGKYYELSPDAIVLVKEDRIKPGDKKNNAIIYTEDGIVEGEIEGKYLEASKYQLKEGAIEEYKYTYKVLPETGINLRSTPNLLENNINRVMGISEGEYVLGAVPERTKENEYPWVKILYINEHGINQGFVREDLLERVDIEKDENKEESLDGKVMRVDTEHDGGIDLNCRSSAEIKKGNIIDKIPSGELVYLTGEKKISDARSWAEIKYKDEKGDHKTGWVDNFYLKEVIEKQMRVKTDAIGEISLEIKEKPSEKSDSVLKLGNGCIINITQNDWDSRVEKDGQEWLKVNIDGKIGYIESEYLEEVIPMIEQKNYYTPNITADELRKIINFITLNDEGKVTGIDSLGATENEIRKLFNNGITENEAHSKALDQNINISNINGDINFMYFRIGASGYGKNFSIIDNTHYIEQVEKCEELGIPYGFYYYSTAVDEEEASKEYEHIEKALDSFGELKYNLLPFAVDVELAANPQKDRQYGKDVTEAKAYLTNCLQDDLGVDVIMYTSGSCTLSTTEDANILDLEEYNRLTGVENVWMPMPKQSNGSVSKAYQNYLSKFPECMKLVMKQEVLDMMSNGAQIDLNTISKNDLIKMLEKVLEKIENKEKTEETEKITPINATTLEY